MRGPTLGLVLAVLVAGGCGAGQDPALELSELTTQSAGGAGAAYLVALTGGAVVPGPGDADGAGTASIQLAPDRSEVCYSIAVKGIGPPTGAHIHRGRAGEPGAVVLDLSPPAEGPWESCSAADPALVAALAADPSAFFVNVHTGAHPQGAIRGQLQPGS